MCLSCDAFAAVAPESHYWSTQNLGLIFVHEVSISINLNYGFCLISISGNAFRVTSYKRDKLMGFTNQKFYSHILLRSSF